MPYLLRMADHFHYMDEDESYELGHHDTAPTAIAELRCLVNRSLLHLYRPGMSARELFEAYSLFGDDPYIVAEGGAPRVDVHAWDHAKKRAAELTGRLGWLHRRLARLRGGRGGRERSWPVSGRAILRNFRRWTARRPGAY
jgi:hypothetical protein